MIKRDGGRTSGLTDWQLMDVLSMWACLHDQETTGHWKQVAGWRKVCDLAQTHLSRLREYRRGLAEAWPPETNAAARTYIAELDQLVDKVQRTHDAAAANHDALSAAARALGSARASLEPIYREYATRLQQKQAYEATVADPKALAGSRLPDKPVTAADLEQLNVQARKLMTGLSGELQQAQVMLRQPPPTARPGPRVDEPPVDPYKTGGGSTPIIPPVVAVPISPSPVRVSHPTTTNKARLPSSTGPNVGPVLGSGPVLGGAGTGIAPPPASPGLSNPTPPTPASPGSAIGLTPGAPANPGVGKGGAMDGWRRGGPAPMRRSITNPDSLPPASSRSIPPSGIIGSSPSPGIGQGPTPPRRANPIGGVIGGGGAGTAPTGSAGSRPGSGRTPHLGSHGIPPLGGAPGMHGAAGMSGGTRSRPGHPEERDGLPRRWDPDNPWEIDSGVDPVVRPPDDDGPINPGPAIGFER